MALHMYTAETQKQSTLTIVVGFAFRVSNSESRASEFGSRVSGLGSRASGFESRVSGFQSRVSGFGFTRRPGASPPLHAEPQILPLPHSPAVGFHLTECIIKMISESQLSHKSVNLLFTITHQNNKLTVLWGGVTFYIVSHEIRQLHPESGHGFGHFQAKDI